MSRAGLFDEASDMGPLLPEDRAGKLAMLAPELIRKAERLRGCLHPVTRTIVAELVRSMISNYSNLFEGHRTMPTPTPDSISRAWIRGVRRRLTRQPKAAWRPKVRCKNSSHSGNIPSMR